MAIVPSSGEPRAKKRPSAKHDRAIAMIIWVITGLMFGLAIGIFTNHGFLWLAIGFVLGIVLAIFRTKPEQQIEED